MIDADLESPCANTPAPPGTAGRQQAAAEQARAAAESRANAAQGLAEAAEAALAQLRAQLATCERNGRDLETGRVRAEAQADSLRLVLADLREDLRATLRGQPKTT